MPFFIFDYSNTHIFHRKALLNAIKKANAKSTSSDKLTIVVSTRNMIKALPVTLLGRITPVLNITGFGRLYSNYGIIGRAIFNMIIRLYDLRGCAGFIVEHDVDKSHLKQIGVGPIFTTYGSGLDVDGFSRKFHKKGQTLKIGYLSRFDKSKGSHEILKIAQNLPDDYELIIAGWDVKGNRFTQNFKKCAEQDNISFLGRLSSREAVSDFFNSIDIFLSPSLREGGNISLQEAIWHRVPFITTDAPGCRVLAERFNCPAVKMGNFANFILTKNLDQFISDTSLWDEKLSPFMSLSVEAEFTDILVEIDHKRNSQNPVKN